MLFVLRGYILVICADIEILYERLELRLDFCAAVLPILFLESFSLGLLILDMYCRLFLATIMPLVTVERLLIDLSI